MIRLVSFLTLSVLLIASGLSQESREISKTVPLNSDGRLSIDTYKGSMVITTWDKPEVEVKATIEADGSYEDAEEDVRETEVKINGSGGEVRVKTDYDNLRHHHSGFWGWLDGENGSQPLVHYRIIMPRTARLHIKDYKSRTKISGLSSDLSLNTYKGEVEIESLSGAIDLETYKGDVDVRFTKLGGDSRFETYKGQVTIVLPKRTGFVLDSDFGKHGNLDTEFDVERGVRGKHRKQIDYRGAVNGGGPTLHLQTEKGTYRLQQS